MNSNYNTPNSKSKICSTPPQIVRKNLKAVLMTPEPFTNHECPHAPIANRNKLRIMIWDKPFPDFGEDLN